MIESGIVVLLLGFSLMFVRPVEVAIRHHSFSRVKFETIVVAVRPIAAKEERREPAGREVGPADTDRLVRGIAAVAKTYDWA